jgi:3-oxoadipate enol-lactonase
MKTRLDVEAVGNGAPILLLHSLLSDRTSFKRLAALLADQRRSILVNLPGFGASPPTQPALAAYADRVLELCDDLSLPPDTDVLGNGFGAFIALAAASRRSEIFGRLVLAGSGVAFPEAGRAAFRGMAEKVERDGIQSLADAAMQRMLSPEFIAAHPEIVAERKAAFRAIPPDVFAGACRALAALDLSSELSSIRNPVLVVVGSQDPATPPALGRDLAERLPDARMIEMPGVGHAPHVEDPKSFLAAIGPFLGLKDR